ncbi:hypothetical protein ID866_10483, partial [Astraeus odoratus]
QDTVNPLLRSAVYCTCGGFRGIAGTHHRAGRGRELD